MTIHTEADFDGLCWHDCPIWGLAWKSPEVEENDWTSDLILDLDFIVEWLCGPDGGCRFKIAPATLTFHSVTDLKVHIHWEDSGFQVSIHEAAIDSIDREIVKEQKVCLDRPYYNWRIPLNWPAGGMISFGAVGFTQRLLAEPIVTTEQRLPRRERDRLIGGHR